MSCIPLDASLGVKNPFFHPPQSRKRLLVKDYLIYRDPSKKTEYIKMALGVCISNHIKMPEIEKIAKEAIAIGNDFVHFAKYTQREVRDLRELINLVWRWIELNEEISVANARISSKIPSTP